jgi:hypothetical protein
MAFVADAFESVVDAVVDVVETVVDSVTYLVTGNYEGDNGDNTFTAVVANLLHQQDQRQSYCPKHFY